MTRPQIWGSIIFSLVVCAALGAYFLFTETSAEVEDRPPAHSTPIDGQTVTVVTVDIDGVPVRCVAMTGSGGNSISCAFEGVRR